MKYIIEVDIPDDYKDRLGDDIAVLLQRDILTGDNYRNMWRMYWDLDRNDYKKYDDTLFNVTVHSPAEGVDLMVMKLYHTTQGFQVQMSEAEYKENEHEN